ncbi:helix-turn-helix domain-containing protein [Taibaiella soli]|uniref:AraC family transcriptional regulator n=1 Tax=Taibaiella soli TaxID=1649169 RepID=A0A2W2BEP6_9BACT|nr:AraC family transcriptional regulator [Taibaiella soli]PZF74729.1 AraC family transcriptional regulator [Taibaiella soli]
MENRQDQQITYSCYYAKSREGEQFAPEHVFNYQISGTLTVNDGERDYVTNAGDFRFIKRNSLLKFNKVPPENGEFKSISIFLTQEMLRDFSMEHHIVSDGDADHTAVHQLPAHPLYQSFIQSLAPYEFLTRQGNEELFRLKLKEVVMLLLKVNPELKNVLFDFAEPGKIDLEEFMNKNYHFNVEMKRFAHLTGRSLATFKRDFEKIFHLSPSRWLQQKRLQEAYFLIKEKGRAPSDVYLDLGFEDLSHFSFAFKKKYGVAPSFVKA